MKRILLSLVAFVCAIGGFAQSPTVTEFIMGSPWDVTVGDIVEQMDGVELCPTAEALAPSPVPTVKYFAEENLTLSGFTFAGHEAYLTTFARAEDENFFGYIAFLSPQKTTNEMTLFFEIVNELDEKIGPPTSSFNRYEEFAEGASFYLGGMWMLENTILTPLCVVMPDESESPVLFGVLAVNTEVLMDEEESEGVEMEEAEAEVVEVVEPRLVSPQELAYFIANVPWGCGIEELAELFQGHTTSLQTALADRPAQLEVILPSINTNFVITDYWIEDFEVLVNVYFSPEDTAFLNTQALILPHEGVTTSEGVEIIKNSLLRDFGTPELDEVLDENLYGQEGVVVSTRTVWVTDKTAFGLSVAYNRENPEQPLFFLLNISEIGYFFASVERAEEEVVRPEGVLDEELVDFGAGDEGHIHFRGISLNRSLEEFSAEMVALGYVLDEDEVFSGWVNRWMFGYYGDRECGLVISSSSLSGRIFCVRVILWDEEEAESWAALCKTYNTYKRRLTNKYGEPTIVVEKLDEYYEEGSGLELVGIENGKNVYASQYTDGTVGLVTLEILATKGGGSVVVTFHDNINYILYEKEVESQM